MADISKISLSGAEYNLKDPIAREGLSALETAQRALDAGQGDIPNLSTNYTLTTDATYRRYKKYYSRTDDTYTELRLGVDYSFGDTIEADTVYEQDGVCLSMVVDRINEVVDVINTIIPAHRVIEPEQAS